MELAISWGRDEGVSTSRQRFNNFVRRESTSSPGLLKISSSSHTLYNQKRMLTGEYFLYVALLAAISSSVRSVYLFIHSGVCRMPADHSANPSAIMGLVPPCLL